MILSAMMSLRSGYFEAISLSRLHESHSKHYQLTTLKSISMKTFYSKYRNKPTEIAGKKFDSQKEANRFLQLQRMERWGMIWNLQTQVRYLLLPSFKYNWKTERKTEYVADFVYTRNGLTIVEDVKSPITKANPVYRIKRKLLLHKYPDIIFIET